MSDPTGTPPADRLAAYYVVAKNRADRQEERALFWRGWAFIGWGLALGSFGALLAVVFG